MAFKGQEALVCRRHCATFTIPLATLRPPAGLSFLPAVGAFGRTFPLPAYPAILSSPSPAFYAAEPYLFSHVSGEPGLPRSAMSAAAQPGWESASAVRPSSPSTPPVPHLTASRTSHAAPTEAELIDGCLRGSQLAQKQLYEQYAPRMMAVCLRYAQTTFEAEDVLQEGFLTVFRTLSGFRRECPLEFWVRRIMINAALRQHRRNAPLVAVSDGDYPETLSSEEFTLSNYNFQELLTMVQELAPRYRMVFNLYAIEGYTHKEIGELLSISEGTSKSQYSRARVILQTKLERLNAPRHHVR